MCALGLEGSTGILGAVSSVDRRKPAELGGGGDQGSSGQVSDTSYSVCAGGVPHPEQFSDASWVSCTQLNVDTIYPETASGPTGYGLSPTTPPSSDTSPKFRLFLVLLIHWL